MKREIAAGLVLLLLAIGSWFNLNYLREFTGGLEGYTHIFIRHSEIDSTTDAFFELMSDVRSGDAESAAGSYEKLLAHLSSLYTMERVTLGSIF